MPLTHENLTLLSKLFISSYKESSYERSKFSPFPNLYASYMPVYILEIFRSAPKMFAIF